MKATDYFSQPEAAAGVRNGCTAIQSLIATSKICLPRTIFLPPRVFFLRRSRLTGTSLPSAAARARARSQGTNVVGNLHPRALSFFRHPRALSFFGHPRARRPQAEGIDTRIQGIIWLYYHLDSRIRDCVLAPKFAYRELKSLQSPLT